MEYNLADGSSAPEQGDRVRVRVLRGGEGELAVDRPNRDYPLEIEATSDIPIPDEPGTYEVLGEVNRVVLAEREGSDFLFLSGVDVQQVADELIELPQVTDEPGWRETDATDADVDVDINSVLDEKTAVDKSDARSSSSVTDSGSLTESLNELLLGKQ